jgi:mono/diheme cytochrome c family protein/peroxiredoxin
LEPERTTLCSPVTGVNQPRRPFRQADVDHAHRRPSGFRRFTTLRTLIALALVTGVVCCSIAVVAYRSASLKRAIGGVASDFAIKDVRTGLVHRLSDHRGRVVAIVFIGTACPIGELYLPRLNDLARKYESRDVDFVAINSNASESAEDVAEHARASAVRIPVLKDIDNQVADRMLAERTCEVLLIDESGRIRYRGAIDDQYELGARRDRATHDYLVDAIDALLAGRRVELASTAVVGCPIERTNPAKQRPKAAAPGPRAPSPSVSTARTVAEAAPATATYADGVAQILHAKCAGCHRPGQVAPFSLLKYDQARRWSTSIAEVVSDGRMPPWHADPRYGHWANDRGLSEKDRARLLAWAHQGAPSGDLSKAPTSPAFPHGWSIGTPDIVFELPDPVKVNAEGAMPILHFRVPTDINEDLWIQAAEVRPSDRTVVHHIFVYSETYDKSNPKHKSKIFLASYLPGDVPPVYPAGVAKRLPKGATLVFEIHYTPIGRIRFDRPSVGFILAKTAPRHVAITRGLAAHGLRIPPGASDHVERADWTINSDVHIISLSPHMHLRGKSFVYQAHYPDGRVEVLLSVPRYDFNWQSVYRFAEPKQFSKGTRIHCEAHYDNSTANPANPDPGRTVTWGEQSWDEMMMGYLDYFEDD